MGWLADALFGKPKNVPPTAERQAADEWGATNKNDDEDQDKDSALSSVVGQDLKSPEVALGRIEARLKMNFNQIELWVALENHSDGEVEVTRVECLGVRAEPSRFLQPGEVHDICLYVGEVPRNDDDHDATVTYKDIASGEYYRADHYLRYHSVRHEDADYYVPEKFYLQLPVRLVS